jgi:hypothetical protein
MEAKSNRDGRRERAAGKRHKRTAWRKLDGSAWATLKLGRKKLTAGKVKYRAGTRRLEAVYLRRFLRHRSVPPWISARYAGIRVAETERQEPARTGAPTVGLE